MTRSATKTLVPLLSTTDAACQRHLDKLLSRGESASAQVEAAVRSILHDVHKRGDRALIALTKKFDQVALASHELGATQAEMEQALKSLAPPVRKALRAAAQRIRRFHRKQRQSSWTYRDELGVTLGQKIAPLERVGVYVPGGTAAYPSSVLMNVIPAKVAGSKKLS